MFPSLTPRTTRMTPGLFNRDAPAVAHDLIGATLLVRGSGGIVEPPRLCHPAGHPADAGTYCAAQG